jgi:ribosome-associated translation inhibitor RaiA
MAHGMGFRRLSIRMKAIHKVENNQKFEIHVAIEGFGRIRSAEMTDKNIFKALDLACKKLLVEIQKTR